MKLFLAALHPVDNILYFSEDCGSAAFSCNDMVIFNVDLNNINLDNNFHEDNPNTIIFIKVLASHIKFEKRKALKKELNEELMPIGWYRKKKVKFFHPRRRKKKK